MLSAHTKLCSLSHRLTFTHAYIIYYVHSHTHTCYKCTHHTPPPPSPHGPTHAHTITLTSLIPTGSETWPAGAYICQWSGHTLGASSTVTLLPCLRPGEEADVSVSLVSPHSSGFFQSQWKMFTSGGTMCGGVYLLLFLSLCLSLFVYCMFVGILT